MKRNEMMELPNFEALGHRTDAIGAAAIAVTEATHVLSRFLHSTDSGAIPVDTAYGLLFHNQMLLHYIASITDNLPSGLHSSVEEPRHNVHEMSGKAQRNLHAQIDIIAKELKTLTEALATAIAHAEATQTMVDVQDAQRQ